VILVYRLIFISSALTLLCGLTAQAAVPIPSLKPGVEAPQPVKVQHAVRVPGARYFEKSQPYPVLKPANTAKAQGILRKPVIVIDPGHGGKDPGAIGGKGTLEKTITTTAANELAARLRRSGAARLFTRWRIGRKGAPSVSSIIKIGFWMSTCRNKVTLSGIFWWNWPNVKQKANLMPLRKSFSVS